MKMQLNRLVTLTANLLGEPLALECEPDESPVPGLESRVRVIAPGLLSEMIMDASPESLFPGKKFSSQPEIDDNGTVTISLPDDFLRLICIKMSDWERPVTEITDYTSPFFSLQSSDLEGVRGSAERPVAIPAYKPDGGRAIKLYSSKKGAVTEIALYTPRPLFDDNDYIEIPSDLTERLIMRLAEALKI